VPLSRAAMNQSFSMSPRTRAARQGRGTRRQRNAGGLMLNPGELTQLLDAARGHPRVALGR